MNDGRGTIYGRGQRLLPCVLFLIVIAGMTGAAELMHEREIIFPEAAAIALGALAAPRLAWKTDKAGILLTIALCACLGVVIVRYIPLPLAWQLAAAYLAGQLVLLASRTSFAPLISAAVLPVLLGTRSLVYPVAAIALTAAILALRCTPEHMHMRARTPFVPLPPPGAKEWLALAARTLLVSAMCLIAVRTGWLYLVCPPLLVAFTEFTRTGNAAMRAPLTAVVLLGAGAGIGALCRFLLCALLSLPLTVAALLAGGAILALTARQKMYLPPAAAVALLPMLLPEGALALYPLQAVCAAALYAALALLCLTGTARKRADLITRL